MTGELPPPWAIASGHTEVLRARQPSWVDNGTGTLVLRV